MNRTNQAALTRHLQRGKTYFKDYFRENKSLCHGLWRRLLFTFHVPQFEHTCRDTNPNSANLNNTSSIISKSKELQLCY